ncbi:MAG: hypothetical protein ABIJ18_05845 [archaeon]
MRDLLIKSIGLLVIDGKNSVKSKVKEYCPLEKYKKIFMDALRDQERDEKGWEYKTSFRINLGKDGNSQKY